MKDKKTYIIAEAGVNHNGSLKKAFKLVDVAKDSGADAIKFQLYRIEEKISKIAFIHKYQKKNVGNKSMKNMAQKYELAWEKHIIIKAYCEKKKIKYMSSITDIKSCDFLLKKLNTKVFKISSGEITNLNFLKYCAHKNVPIILSTGMSNEKEISNAVKLIKKISNSKLYLLHCISLYPTPIEILNIRYMNTLKKKYKCEVGFSDHSEGYLASCIAVATGARIIEKHFTINKKLPGPDHAMSLSPKELKEFVKKIRETELILGEGKKKISFDEKEMIKVARRGIIAIKDINKNEIFTNNNTSIMRPCLGLGADQINNVLGKFSSKYIKKNTPIIVSMIK